MNSTLYVGNLSFETTDTDLRELFTPFGPVGDVTLPKDHATGQPRGFAFVAMETAEAMNAAMNAWNGKTWQGRALIINEARPRTGAGHPPRRGRY